MNFKRLCSPFDLGSFAIREMLTMLTSYLACLYFGVLLLLLITFVVLDERLLRYVQKRYQREGALIRSYQGQWYPWSKGRKTLRMLVKKSSYSDAELARRAQRARVSEVLFLVWFSLGLVAFGGVVMYLTIWRGR